MPKKAKERSMAKLIRKSLGESTANILRERIITGEYPAGMRIREDELAREFDISRICVREALLILDREGLLDKRANRPACVRTYSAKNVKDLLEYRAMLETAAAASLIKSGVIPEAELEEAIEQMRRLHEGAMTSQQYLEADILFHDTLIRSVKNEYFDLSWSTVRSQYLMLMYALYKVRGEEFSSGFEAHMKIVDMLKKADTQGVRELIIRHVMSNCDSIYQLVCVE